VDVGETPIGCRRPQGHNTVPTQASIGDLHIHVSHVISSYLSVDLQQKGVSAIFVCSDPEFLSALFYAGTNSLGQDVNK
jgi:hypothetical protein